MQAFTTRVIRTGSDYWMRVPADRVQDLPQKESFSVRVSKPEKPFTVYVPTMETRLRRFGRDQGLTVPKVLVTAGVLKHRADILVTLVPRAV